MFSGISEAVIRMSAICAASAVIGTLYGDNSAGRALSFIMGLISVASIADIIISAVSI